MESLVKARLIAFQRRTKNEERSTKNDFAAGSIVPVRTASDRLDTAARTLRPRLQRQLPRFMQPLNERAVKQDSLGLSMDGLDLRQPDRVLAGLKLDRTVSPVSEYRGGYGNARRRLREFVEQRLRDYDEGRNEPAGDVCSGLSPYLHFGQISALEVALYVQDHAAGLPAGAVSAFLEELIVRRELSMNMVTFNPLYDAYDGLPAWARRSLAEHRSDVREALYSRDELEQARTGDDYWNAAQVEMLKTGKMQGYMRMYWGKRLIEWHAEPQAAFETALYLNDKYELDGRDANGFAGVAWCFGNHDHGWPEREVFGKVRCMKPSGLERKFDIAAYVRGRLSAEG